MSDKGHLSSQVANFAASTSTGNLNLHVSCKHDVVCRSDEKCAKILSFISKYKSDQSVGAMSKHEVSRDITIWFCRDLLSFDLVERDDFRDFFKKKVPGIQIPSDDTLGASALEDVYRAVQSELKQKLSGVNSVCLLFDGWTDKYRRRPYMGVRCSFFG